MSIDPAWEPDTTGDLEPVEPVEVVLRVQFSPIGAAEVTGDGIRIPPGMTHVQLVAQPDGCYGLRFVG